jgi:hypothetical protein
MTAWGNTGAVARPGLRSGSGPQLGTRALLHRKWRRRVGQRPIARVSTGSSLPPNHDLYGHNKMHSGNCFDARTLSSRRIVNR